MNIGIPTEGTQLLIFLAGIALLVYAYVIVSKNKKDVKKFATIIGVIALVIGTTGFGMQSSVQAPPPGSAQMTTKDTTITVSSTTEEKLINPLESQFQDRATGYWNTVAGTLSLYEYGVNPSDANVRALFTSTVASGTHAGTEFDGRVYANKRYGIYFDGAGTYYDMKYPSDMISASATTAATTSALVSFSNVMLVGAFTDPLDESSVTGIINGQTNLSGIDGAAGGNNEIQVGDDVTPVNGERMYYNESDGNQAFHIQYIVEQSTSNAYLKNPVMCFVSDNSAPWASNAITAYSDIHISGSNSDIPSDLLTHWQNDDCVSLNGGKELTSGFSETRKFTITLDESKLTAGDRMYIYLDDLGSHLGKDILLNKKATAVTVMDLTIE